MFYHPNKVNENGDVIFNTDLVKMKIDVRNAEKILKNALNLLKGEMPEPKDSCNYCKWAESNHKLS